MTAVDGGLFDLFVASFYGDDFEASVALHLGTTR